jgi:hypothetical protein
VCAARLSLGLTCVTFFFRFPVSKETKKSKTSKNGFLLASHRFCLQLCLSPPTSMANDSPKASFQSPIFPAADVPSVCRFDRKCKSQKR